jgi:RecJ-like exonuclease
MGERKNGPRMQRTDKRCYICEREGAVSVSRICSGQRASKYEALSGRVVEIKNKIHFICQECARKRRISERIEKATQYKLAAIKNGETALAFVKRRIEALEAEKNLLENSLARYKEELG